MYKYIIINLKFSVLPPFNIFLVERAAVAVVLLAICGRKKIIPKKLCGQGWGADGIKEVEEQHDLESRSGIFKI
jgi:hypothetical protein